MFEEAAVSARRRFVIDILTISASVVATDRVGKRGTAKVARNEVRYDLREGAERNRYGPLSDFAMGAGRRVVAHVHDRRFGRPQFDRPEGAVVDRPAWIQG